SILRSTAPRDSSTLSLHDALPIWLAMFQTLAWFTAAAVIFLPRAALVAPSSVSDGSAAPPEGAVAPPCSRSFPGAAPSVRRAAGRPVTGPGTAPGAALAAAGLLAPEGPPAADAGAPVICPPPQCVRASPGTAARPPGRHPRCPPPSPRPYGRHSHPRRS